MRSRYSPAHRGPGVVNVLKLVMVMVEDRAAQCVAGSHKSKPVRKLKGHNVQVSHGLAESLEQLAPESGEFQQQANDFPDGPVSHCVLDSGPCGDEGGVPGDGPPPG